MKWLATAFCFILPLSAKAQWSVIRSDDAVCVHSVSVSGAVGVMHKTISVNMVGQKDTLREILGKPLQSADSGVDTTCTVTLERTATNLKRYDVQTAKDRPAFAEALAVTCSVRGVAVEFGIPSTCVVGAGWDAGSQDQSCSEVCFSKTAGHCGMDIRICSWRDAGPKPRRMKR